ncbi:MAG: biotin/lipoyl-containing protein [Bacteroidota bacterium]|nr:biotin/lipoyl-containing protein [Bacteroidota bacterium]MDP4230168.1 biotin/lipoyl-containing protein [Bacteroidota bacterium]
MKQIRGEINGKTVVLDSMPEVIEESPTHFLVRGKNGLVEIFVTSGGLLSDGNALDGIEVKVESERDRIIRERFSGVGKESGSGKGGNSKTLKAPMPGMVRAITVQAGDIVEKHTQVILLEAMKMENSILAGFSGIVAEVLVEAGSSVEKNAPMLRFKGRE